MFIIFKNTIRTFYKSKSQTFIVLALLVFVGFYFSLFCNTILPVIRQFNDDKLSSNMEQFRFYPDFEISDNEWIELSQDYKITPEDFSILSMQDISHKYNVDLSKYSDKYAKTLSENYNYQYTRYDYKNVLNEDTLFSITFYDGDIDQNIFAAGSGPQKDDEAALGVGYADANDINIGDEIEIKDKVYKICGIYYDLGNTYVYDSADSKTVFVKDNAKVLVAEAQYFSIDAKNNTVYLGRFNNEMDDIDSKIQEMLESEQFSYLLPSNSVSNVAMFEMTLQSQLSMMYLGSILVFVITIIFISMFISGHIKKSKKQFGIMLAMGYKKSRIITSYVYFPLLFMMLVICGTFLGYAGRSFITAQLEMGFNFPIKTNVVQINAMLVFSVTCAILIGIFMIVRVYKSLNKKPLDLIAAKKVNKNHRMNNFVRNIISKLPFKQHMKYSFTFSKMSRFVIMIGCVLVSIVLINLALSLYLGYNKGVEVFRQDTDFVEIVNFNEVKTLSDTEVYKGKFLKTSAFLSTIDDRKIDKTIDIEFVDFNTVPIDFNIDSSETGVIVPIRYKYLNNASVGDSIVIKGKDGILNQTIIAFSELSVNNTFYISNSLITDYDKALEKTLFNGEYLSAPYNDSDYYSITSKDILVNQIVELQQNSSAIVMLLIIFSLLASFFMVNIISGNNISDNIQGITIMMMSGYKKKTISSLLLNIYVFAMVIGGIAAVGLLSGILEGVTIMLNTSDIGFIQISFSWLNICISFTSVIIIYYISLFIARNRYLKLNIREVMSEE